MIDDQHLFDLLVQERKGQLSGPEQQELEAALAKSPTLQLAAQAHRGFEELGAYEPRDDERCEAVARAVRARLGWNAEPRGERGWPRRAQAAALALMFAAVAAAASVTTWKLASRADGAAPVPSPSLIAPRAAAPLMPRVADAPTEPTNQDKGTEVEPRPAVPAAEPAPPKLSDERLFVQATELKGAGKWPAAQALYERLLREYPGSKYAPSCMMTLGKRALAEGKAERALSWFRRYQARRGPLLAEAMWGEADALGRLGREPERAKVMAVLNKRFPLSPYASEKPPP